MGLWLFVYLFIYFIKTSKVHKIGATYTYRYDDVYNIQISHMKYTNMIKDTTGVNAFSLYKPRWQGNNNSENVHMIRLYLKGFQVYA